MKPKFAIVEGTEKYRIVDLSTGEESFTDDKLEAYRYAGLFISWGHTVKLEERDDNGEIAKVWESSRMVA